MKFYTEKRDGYTLKMSRSLPYRGYGQLPKAPIVGRPAAPPLVAPPLEPVAPLLPSPTLQKGENAAARKDEATTTLAGGSVLSAAGLLGGLGLAVFGGPLSTGVKVLSGVASAAASVGGGVIAAKGYKEREAAVDDLRDYNRLRDLLDARIPPGDLTPKDGNLDVGFDHPDAFLSIRDRIDPAVPVKIEFFHKGFPTQLMRERGRLPTVPRNVIDVQRPMELFSVQGLNIGLPPGRWQKIAYIRSINEKIDANLSRFTGQPTPRYETATWNKTDFFDEFDSRVCRVNSWMFGQPRETKTYLAGGVPDYMRKRGERGAGTPPPIEWFVSNVPEGLYFDSSTNWWLRQAAEAWARVDDDYPVDTTSGGFPNPDEIEGPMAALMEIYKAFRGLSTEAVTIYGSPQAFQQSIVHAAKVIDVRPWWHNISSFFGTIFGYAAYVTQAAMPIIAAINPALGATIGAAASAIVGTARSLYEAYTGTARELRDQLGRGWTDVTNFYGNCETVANSYWDVIGPAMPRDIAALTPPEQLMDMSWRTYTSGSESLLATVNLNPESPIYINKLIGYLNKVS